MKQKGRRAWISVLAVAVPLFAVLAATIWFAINAWTSIEGPPMPASGWGAMVFGIVFTLVVGIGLMGLLFYSRRHGYDDAADRGRSEPRE